MQVETMPINLKNIILKMQIERMLINLNSSLKLFEGEIFQTIFIDVILTMVELSRVPSDIAFHIAC